MNHPDIKLGIYKHKKGLLAQVLAVARHTETEERLVIYVPINGKLEERKGPMVSARPIDMFLEKFEYIGHTLN